MARGQLSPDGATRVAANKYHYTKVKDRGWVLTHWLTIEKELGREINPEKESVRFRDGFDRKDFANPDAIMVIPKKSSSMRKRLAALEAKRDAIDAEITYIKSQLEKLR